MITIQDLINGMFEGIAGFLMWINVKSIIKDKETKGIHWLPMVFFNLWGFWNIYYYRFLFQPISFYGGINMTLANTTWVTLAIYYMHKKNKGKI